MCVPIDHLAMYLDYHGYADDRPVDRPDVFRSGAGWIDLGLTVPVTGATLHAIGSHVHPESGRTLGSGTAKVSGYSVLFTCHKSVSIVACFDSRVRQAFQDAVKVTVTAAEVLSGMARDRRGVRHDTDAVQPTGRVLAVGHFEHQNRNQEPHEHADVFWLNATCVDRRRDVWRALQVGLLMRSQVDLWDFLNLELACRLRELGYAATYADGVTSLPFVPPSLCKKMSSRADEIMGWYRASGYTEEKVTSGRVERARRSDARKASARAKSEELSPEAMQERLEKADAVAVREIQRAVAAAEVGSAKSDPAVRSTPDDLDAVVDRLPLGTAHYLDVRLACAVASTHPGVISPVAALERMRKRFRRPEAAPWTLAVSLPEPETISLPVIRGLSALGEASRSRTADRKPPARAALRSSATASENSIAASRSSVVGVVGTVAQLDRFARVVLGRKMPGRRSTRPVVVPAEPRIAIIDARRALIDEALRVAGAEIKSGRRVVLLLDQRDPAHSRTLSRLPGAPFFLRGKPRKKKQKRPAVKFTAFVDATGNGPPRRGRAVFMYMGGQGRSLRIVEPPKEAIRHYAAVDPSTRKLLSFRRFRRERVVLTPGTRIAYVGREKDARVEVGVVDQVRDRRSIRLRDRQIIDGTKVTLFVLRTPTRRVASPNLALPDVRKPSGPRKRSKRPKTQMAPEEVVPTDPVLARAPVRKPGSKKPRTPKWAPPAQLELPAEDATRPVSAEDPGKPSTVVEAQPNEVPALPVVTTIGPAEVASIPVKVAVPEADQKIPVSPVPPAPGSEAPQTTSAPDPETQANVSGVWQAIHDPDETKQVIPPPSGGSSALDVEEAPDKVAGKEAEHASESQRAPVQMQGGGAGARPPEPESDKPQASLPSPDDADLELDVPGSASKADLLRPIEAAREPRDPNQVPPDID
jgi:conjugative relaxase-like TrwC/TraI family protein